MRIRFNQKRFIIALDGKIKHLILFAYGLFNKTCDKIKYIVSKKSGYKEYINHNFGKIRIDSYDSLPIKKILSFHKRKNKYYYTIFLEQALYKDE